MSMFNVSIDTLRTPLNAFAIVAFTHLYTAGVTLWRVRIRIIIPQITHDY